MECQRIVSAKNKRHSYRSWESRFCITTYVSHFSGKQQWVWKVKTRSLPMTMQELDRLGVWYTIPLGGLHNQPIDDPEAVEELTRQSNQSSIEGFLGQLVDKYMPSDQK